MDKDQEINVISVSGGKDSTAMLLLAIERIVAQDLMEYAYEHERQALINVLKHNTHETLAETPGLREAHERFILGKHYEQVRQWELEDDAFLGELQATGKFKEQAEEAK